MGYGMIKIDERWWKWDKEGEMLIDGRGMIRGESTREFKGGNKKVEKVREKDMG